MPATVPGTVKENEFEIKTAFNVKPEGKGSVASCELDIQKGSVPFELDGNLLTIRDVLGASIRYTRILSN